MADPREPKFVEQLDATIDRYMRRNSLVRRVFWSARITAMALGAASTVLLGIGTDDPGYRDWSRNLVLAFTALATFLTGLGTFWRLEEYWIRRKAAEHRLRLLRARLEYARAAPGGLAADQLDQFFDEYLAVLGSQGEYWARLAERPADGSAVPAARVPGIQHHDLPAHPDDK